MRRLGGRPVELIDGDQVASVGCTRWEWISAGPRGPRRGKRDQQRRLPGHPGSPSHMNHVSDVGFRPSPVLSTIFGRGSVRDVVAALAERPDTEAFQRTTPAAAASGPGMAQVTDEVEQTIVESFEPALLVGEATGLQQR